MVKDGSRTGHPKRSNKQPPKNLNISELAIKVSVAKLRGQGVCLGGYDGYTLGFGE